MVEQTFYVAALNDVVVATGAINMATSKIDAIFVDPAHIGTGLGKLILFYLEGLAIKSGLSELTLESTLNAVSFYRSQGFIGSLVATYKSPSGVSMDCIPMVKSLTIVSN